MADLVKQFFSKADIDAIEQAVKQAEAHTAGEILVRIVTRSHNWKSERLVLSGSLALLVALGSLWWTRTQDWGTYYDYGSALLWGGAAFVLFFFLFSDSMLKSVGRRKRMVHERAELELKRMPSTKGQTGVLIYVSLDEHWAVVLGEQSVYKIVPQEFWETPLKEIVDGIKRGDHAEGICSAVNIIGRELASVLPRQTDDKDELPDRPQMG